MVAVPLYKVNPDSGMATILHNDNKLCSGVHCVICYIVGLCHLLSPLLMFGKVGAFASLISIWQLIDCEEIKVK